MTMHPHDMTPVVGLTHERGTGPARTQRPIYVSLLPPCNHACPAGENIQAWLAHAQAGKFQKAWLALVEDNPLPAVHGRVCYHPCETGCNRADLDSAVSIHAVERFLGDLAAEQGWKVPVAASSGKRVLVVGAGPSGLSAAYHLRRLSHAVEIHEARPLPGGMMHFGIPAYRLPREDLMKEIGRIEAMGVKIVLNHKVENVAAARSEGQFDADFVAIGTQIGKRIDIPARASGYWPLFQFDPAMRTIGENPFRLDSPRPTIPFKNYARNEVRYTSLAATKPKDAEELMTMAQAVVTEKYRQYEDLAASHPRRFHPDAQLIDKPV